MSEQIFHVWTEISVNKSFIVYLQYIKQYKMKLYRVGALFTVLVRCSVHTPVRTPMYGLPLSQSDQRIRSVVQSVYNNTSYNILPTLIPTMYTSQLVYLSIVLGLGHVEIITSQTWGKDFSCVNVKALK